MARAQRLRRHHIEYIMLGDADHAYPLFAHVFCKTGIPMHRLVFEHCWNTEWDNHWHCIVTDSRYTQLEVFKEGWRRGVGVIGTVTAPKPITKKKKREVQEEEEARLAAEALAAGHSEQEDSDSDGGGGASVPSGKRKIKKPKTDIRVCCFHKHSKGNEQTLDKGTRFRAAKTFTVEGIMHHGKGNQMRLQSDLWLDSATMAYASSHGVGSDDPLNPIVAKRKGKEVAAFLVQKLHAGTYGGIDRIGKSALEYGQTFDVQPWHFHIIQVRPVPACCAGAKRVGSTGLRARRNRLRLAASLASGQPCCKKSTLAWPAAGGSLRTCCACIHWPVFASPGN